MAVALQYYHRKAAHCLAMGFSEEDAATHVGVRAQDIQRWRRMDSFRQYMRQFEMEVVEPLMGDFISQLRREAYEKLHELLQSSDVEDLKWAISQIFRNYEAQQSFSGERRTDQPVIVQNFVENPDAKRYAKQYLEATDPRRQAIPVRAIPVAVGGA